MSVIQLNTSCFLTLLQLSLVALVREILCKSFAREKIYILFTAGVSLFLILGHTGHKLPLCFVAPDRVFCSPFKSVHRKVSNGKYKKNRPRGLSLWPSFFFSQLPLSAGLARHSSLLGNSFWSFGLVKTMSVVKMARERVKFFSCISANLPLGSVYFSLLLLPQTPTEKTPSCLFF